MTSFIKVCVQFPTDNTTFPTYQTTLLTHFVTTQRNKYNFRSSFTRISPWASWNTCPPSKLYYLMSLLMFQRYTQHVHHSVFSRSFPPNHHYLCCVCTCVCAQLIQLCPHGSWSTRLLCPWNFPSKNTGVGCHALLQGIFLTQESNPCLLCLLHCRWILYCLSHGC